MSLPRDLHIKLSGQPELLSEEVTASLETTNMRPQVCREEEELYILYRALRLNLKLFRQVLKV